ncbi:MAG: GNAT family N-acetyltransferase [Deltaproteobacteria bacterium]|nr:GNAT family N-acetyltransferase [Deltaproteobacteria bacterium]MCB9787299.1 GNAT family N-acetyltransferase [Deltaproteobacteria bacterium]
MVRGSPLRVRAAGYEDGVPIGWLVLDGLDDAPSSDRGPVDVGDEPVDIGTAIVETALARDALLYVAEDEDGVLGAGRVGARELVRSRHVGDLAVLVHPRARRRGVGRALMEALVGGAEASRRFEKLAVRIAADDEALRRTVMGSGAWRLERLEIGALARGERRIDVEVMGLSVRR